jgi:MFS family permease
MLLAGSMLVVLSLAHSSLLPFLAELALLGAGLGLFTPPNNAAIVASAPRSEAGLASGVLNVSRGLGTSLGLALTGLVFGLFAGGRPYLGGTAERGFDVSCPVPGRSSSVGRASGAAQRTEPRPWAEGP